MKLKKKYSLGEEIVNSISHGIGVVFGIVALVLTIVFSAKHHNTLGIIASCLYGSSMIIMYLCSTLYHALSYKLKAKQVFRVIDHSDIYVYIAGCYSPFCISLIRGWIGWTLFAVIWACALIGILLNVINLEKFKVPSLILYLIMGWMIVFSFKSLNMVIARPGLYLLLIGGIIYTIGAILYVIGKKKKYIHSVFHFFVLAGSIVQFFSILLYAI